MRTDAPVQPADCDHLWSDVYGDLQRVGPAHFHERRIARRLLAPLEYRSVLDVGCGPGWNVEMLCEGREVDSVVGVDISPVAIAEATRARRRGSYSVEDIGKSAPAGRHDLVHCSLVIHLVPDDEAAIRNLRACTGRYLLISTMAGDYERYRPWESRIGAVRNYRRGELEGKLSAAGFRVAQAVYWGFPFFSPVARTLQNFGGVGAGSYGPGTRLLARSLRSLFYLNSSSKGDLLVVLARVDDE